MTEVDYFGPGEETAAILMSGVQCTGNETSITSCPHSGITCEHSEDAAVVCEIETEETGRFA